MASVRRPPPRRPSAVWQGKANDGEADCSFSTHMAARDLVVRGVGGGAKANRPALELFYRTVIMGNEQGEAAHLRACGCLVRVRFVRELLRELRARPHRLRKAMGPAVPPKPLTIDPAMWLRKSARLDTDASLDAAPYRRRTTQWRVVHASKIVARSRPATSAPLVEVFEPGELVWGGPPRDDGWLPLSDRPPVGYVLIDGAALGFGRLLERIEPPELANGECVACNYSPCCCSVYASYGL